MDNRGVEVEKSRSLTSDERVYGSWDHLHGWSANEYFVIGLKND